MKDIAPIDVCSLMDHNDDALFFDVRSTVAFNNKAPILPKTSRQAINVPLKLENGTIDTHFTKNIEEIAGKRKNVILIFMCYHGNSSKIACQLLANAQYTSLYNVAGGFQAWETAALPVTTGI